jgi:hypothetical protein
MNTLDSPMTKPQNKPAPPHTITLGDAILRNPANLGKQVASSIMLDANFWLMIDICGSPVWAMA